jgi:Peptidase M16 inactive domain
VRSFTPEALEAFYRRNYRPEKTTLIVAGDVDAEAVKRDRGPVFRLGARSGRRICQHPANAPRIGWNSRSDDRPRPQRYRAHCGDVVAVGSHANRERFPNELEEQRVDALVTGIWELNKNLYARDLRRCPLSPENVRRLDRDAAQDWLDRLLTKAPAQVVSCYDLRTAGSWLRLLPKSCGQSQLTEGPSSFGPRSIPLRTRQSSPSVIGGFPLAKTRTPSQ